MEGGSWRVLKYQLIEVIFFTLLNDSLNTISKRSTGNQLRRRWVTKNYHLSHSLKRKLKIVHYMIRLYPFLGLHAKCFGFINVNYFRINQSFLWVFISHCCKWIILLQRPEWQPFAGATIWLACQPQHSPRTVRETVILPELY